MPLLSSSKWPLCLCLFSLAGDISIIQIMIHIFHPTKELLVNLDSAVSYAPQPLYFLPISDLTPLVLLHRKPRTLKETCRSVSWVHLPFVPFCIFCLRT